MRSFPLFAAAALLVTFFAEPSAARQPWEGRPLYARDLMTRVERKAYWREFRALENDAEREVFYTAHVAAMNQRIVDRGVSEPEYLPMLDDGEQKVVFWRAPYFEDIMTDEERENYFPALDAIPDRLDRWRFVARHIRTMYARGLERGVSSPSTRDFANVFEALGEVAPDVHEWFANKAAEQEWAAQNPTDEDDGDREDEGDDPAAEGIIP